MTIAPQYDALEWYRHVKQTMAGGTVVEFSPAGYSMWPAIWPGRDSVRIAAAPRYRRGDIVLALAEDTCGVVLHRVRSASRDRIVLMGDSNLWQTETCSAYAVAGRVIAVSRDGSHFGLPLRLAFFAAVHRLPSPLRRMAVRIINFRRNGSRRH